MCAQKGHNIIFKNQIEKKNWNVFELEEWNFPHFAFQV